MELHQCQQKSGFRDMFFPQASSAFSISVSFSLFLKLTIHFLIRFHCGNDVSRQWRQSLLFIQYTLTRYTKMCKLTWSSDKLHFTTDARTVCTTKKVSRKRNFYEHFSKWTRKCGICVDKSLANVNFFPL